jgi:hypothetical protein
MTDELLDSATLLTLAAAGDGAAWGALLTAHEARLTRMAAFRMDSRLRGRVDAADIVQEAFVEASAHREVYFREPTVPLFSGSEVWSATNSSRCTAITSAPACATRSASGH